MSENKKYKFAFFGTDEFSLGVMGVLIDNGYIPTLVVTPQSKPVGRKKILTAPILAEFAKTQNISLIQPEKLNDDATEEIKKHGPFDFFIVASYGKIIPKKILDLAQNGALNVHPSLLPKYRGPAPIEGAILANDTITGVSIMLLDEQMDHGPIITQQVETISVWPPRQELENMFSKIGGKLLVEIIPEWCEGNLKAQEQVHENATYTKMIHKSDAEIPFSDLSEKPFESFLKIQAYSGWPNAYFIYEIPVHNNAESKSIRVVIKRASYDQEKNKLKLERVVPEGSNEMDYADFKRGFIDKYKTR